MVGRAWGGKCDIHTTDGTQQPLLLAVISIWTEHIAYNKRQTQSTRDLIPTENCHDKKHLDLVQPMVSNGIYTAWLPLHSSRRRTVPDAGGHTDSFPQIRTLRSGPWLPPVWTPHCRRICHRHPLAGAGIRGVTFSSSSTIQMVLFHCSKVVSSLFQQYSTCRYNLRICPPLHWPGNTVVGLQKLALAHSIFTERKMHAAVLLLCPQLATTWEKQNKTLAHWKSPEGAILCIYLEINPPNLKKQAPNSVKLLSA